MDFFSRFPNGKTDVEKQKEDLSGADLSEAKLEGANLSEVDLEGVDLEGAIMPDGSIHD